MTDPYREGFTARGREETASANPYIKSSDDWKRWLEGWIEHDAHIMDKDESLNSIGWST